MQEHAATTETTEAPKQEGGFPPFDTTTFPTQFFWLVVTFAFLFTVMWRLAGPKINKAITNRRGTINSAIAEATKARAEAVRHALVAGGVAPERVKLRKPETTVGSGSPEEGRRVEVRVQ